MSRFNDKQIRDLHLQRNVFWFVIVVKLLRAKYPFIELAICNFIFPFLHQFLFGVSHPMT